MKKEKKVVIEKGKRIIDKWEYFNHIDIEEVIIPEGVVIIDHGAFCGCVRLQKVITLVCNIKISIQCTDPLSGTHSSNI